MDEESTALSAQSTSPTNSVGVDVLDDPFQRQTILSGGETPPLRYKMACTAAPYVRTKHKPTSKTDAQWRPPLSLINRIQTKSILNNRSVRAVNRHTNVGCPIIILGDFVPFLGSSKIINAIKIDASRKNIVKYILNVIRHRHRSEI